MTLVRLSLHGLNLSQCLSFMECLKAICTSITSNYRPRHIKIMSLMLHHKTNLLCSIAVNLTKIYILTALLWAGSAFLVLLIPLEIIEMMVGLIFCFRESQQLAQLHDVPLKDTWWFLLTGLLLQWHIYSSHRGLNGTFTSVARWPSWNTELKQALLNSLQWKCRKLRSNPFLSHSSPRESPTVLWRWSQ